MSNWKRACGNCDKQSVCFMYFDDKNPEAHCNQWDGWIPSDFEVPSYDEYVLVQLTKDYAGEENITTGIYFPEDEVEGAQWFVGHVSVIEVDNNDI